MSDQKISELAAAGALAGTEPIPVVQGGATKRTTTQDIANLAAAASQPVDADLTAIAALTSAADKVPYATGAGTWALADFTAAGRTLAGAANAAAQITALGLSVLATTVPGTGIAAALAVNVGSAGAFVTNGGALGTPSGGTLTNCTTAALAISGAISAAAWTTSGVGLKETARTLTDTSSSGTVAAAYTHKLGGNTIAASSATTFTNYYSLWLGLPVAGSGATLTSRWSLGTEGAISALRIVTSNANNSFNGIAVGGDSNPAMALTGLGTITVESRGTFGWSQYVSDNTSGNRDVILYRDAAATLAQRNGTNAQTLRVYGTYTDSSNYERASLSSTAGSGITLAAETAGTGGDNLNVTLTPAGTGGVVLGANYQQMTEMTAPAAPGANAVRIYAEDSGGGKTRLMALFPSGSAQQIAIEP